MLSQTKIITYCKGHVHTSVSIIHTSITTTACFSPPAAQTHFRYVSSVSRLSAG